MGLLDGTALEDAELDPQAARTPGATTIAAATRVRRERRKRANRVKVTASNVTRAGTWGLIKSEHVPGPFSGIAVTWGWIRKPPGRPARQQQGQVA